jgi:hypothetical protein
MKKLEVLVMPVVLALLFVGCRKSEPDLSGTWQLALSARHQYMITISKEGKDRYQLAKPGLNFDGLYELRGDRLVMIKPRDPRLTGFVWQLDDSNDMTLVGEPPIGKTGASYLTATLKRSHYEAAHSARR